MFTSSQKDLISEQLVDFVLWEGLVEVILFEELAEFVVLEKLVVVRFFFIIKVWLPVKWFIFLVFLGPF